KAQSAACAFVLIEEVGGEVHAFAHAAAEQVTDRAAYRLAHDVKTGDFDGAKDVREPSRVPGGLVAVACAVAAQPFLNGGDDGVELERILADHHIGGGLQRGGGGGAARHFTQAVDVVVGDDLDDGSQRIGGMQPGGVEQRRVADGDGGHMYIGDLHAISSIEQVGALRRVGGKRKWETTARGDGL